MKLKTIITLLSLSITVAISNAQSNLHIPKEIQNAYKNQTRSKDGKSGKKYWQNSVDYKIEVTVTPTTRLIDGKEEVIFTNNSPDELSEIVIRLYYDVFKKGNIRGTAVNEDDIGKGTDIRKIIVNEMSYDLSNSEQIERSGTIMKIKLSKPLNPGNQINLKFEWQQKVPLTLDRAGTIDDSSFFVGYWYPQVAVYDDIFGWDTTNYTFDTEFYNNLANFDVNITAPDNFLVWATGTLENSLSVFPTEIYKKYNQAKSSKELVHVITTDDLDNLKLKNNTWNFKATEVTDFAFAMSDHYLWDALSQRVAGKDVLINTAFPVKKADKCKEVTVIQQKTMKHFSEDIPGIPYPYPTFTTFIGRGGGGMEFPMMANNGNSRESLTIHEMFHTYFPMYVRINESRFAWMDEGWADFITALVTHKFFNDKNNTSSLYSNFMFGMQGMIGSIGDLPTITSSQYMSTNYGYHSYTLPAFTYSLLYQHLGEEKFLECFRTYIRRWAKKSPSPYDFFYTFEDVSGEDLSFIWNSWYFKMGYPDISIESFEDGNLRIKRIGERIVPISIKVEYNHHDGKKQAPYSSMISSSVWKNNTLKYALKIPNADNVKSIAINSDFPDFNPLDNYFPSLPDQYKAVDIDDNILGEYLAKTYSIKMNISKENGVFKLDFPDYGLENYLIPLDKYDFISLDRTITVKFKNKSDNLQQIEVSFINYGITHVGDKK
ncbi:M1 family metallopeptidase [Aquimarina algiphila]|uniref:M1 family metallopeptidase n=1 Tax=Aquimarina algiphila TaxID=2047982 RepID=UPI00249360A1|nr:M1 family metallopeptidase [Aquimarina algiphila]